METLIVYYSNKVSAFLACFTAAMKLNRVLRKLVGKQVAPPETFHGVNHEGLLYVGSWNGHRHGRGVSWRDWLAMLSLSMWIFERNQYDLTESGLN